jgi:hypothetical protein
MTPAKRRSAAPATQGPARTAPDTPVVPPSGPATTTDSAQVRGAEARPPAEEAPKADAGNDPAPPTTPRSPRRPLSLYPLPVWPD